MLSICMFCLRALLITNLLKRSRTGFWAWVYMLHIVTGLQLSSLRLCTHPVINSFCKNWETLAGFVTNDVSHFLMKQHKATAWWWIWARGSTLYVCPGIPTKMPVPQYLHDGFLTWRDRRNKLGSGPSELHCFAAIWSCVLGVSAYRNVIVWGWTCSPTMKDHRQGLGKTF